MTSTKTPKATKKQLANRKRWIKALRSGKYKQGYGCLGNTKSGYCCLGVGAKVCDVRFVSYATLSESFRDAVGLKTPEGCFHMTSSLMKKISEPEDRPSSRHYTLTYCNDGAHLPFDVIADIIESEPKGLFI